MAGYAGARPRSGTLAPRRRDETPVARRGADRSDRPRTSRAGACAAPPRSGRAGAGRVGLMVVGIVVVFLLGLFSLSQTVRVSATDFDSIA